MITKKSPIALDEFEHRKAMQELAAMSHRNSIAKAEQALSKIQSWKDNPSPPQPEPVKRAKPNTPRLNPPPLKMKRVLCNVSTGKAFREYRESLSIRAFEVYTAIGMSRAKLNDLERGNCKWTESIRRKIADAIYDIVAERRDKEEAAKALATTPQ